MPFQSKSQIQTCYSRKPKGWNCDEWLIKTPDICNLPYKKSKSKNPPTKSRKIKKGEIIKGKIQTGPRGGKYFIIKQYHPNSKKVKCTIKVYV